MVIKDQSSFDVCASINFIGPLLVSPISALRAFQKFLCENGLKAQRPFDLRPSKVICPDLSFEICPQLIMTPNSRRQTSQNLKGICDDRQAFIQFAGTTDRQLLIYACALACIVSLEYRCSSHYSPIHNTFLHNTSSDSDTHASFQVTLTLPLG